MGGSKHVRRLLARAPGRPGTRVVPQICARSSLRLFIVAACHIIDIEKSLDRSLFLYHFFHILRGWAKYNSTFLLTRGIIIIVVLEVYTLRYDCIQIKTRTKQTSLGLRNEVTPSLIMLKNNFV